MKRIEDIKRATNLLIRHVGIDGGSGEIYKGGKPYASVIWSNGGGWDHVSIAPFNRRITPDWEDMCRLKEMFFYDYECCVQYHPPKSEYVNNAPNCLHIWRPRAQTLPKPPAVMVGMKKGQTMKEAAMDMEKPPTLADAIRQLDNEGLALFWAKVMDAAAIKTVEAAELPDMVAVERKGRLQHNVELLVEMLNNPVDHHYQL